MEHGVNYGTGGVMVPDTSDPAVCCDLCAASADCIAWDLNPEDNECWLKTDASGPVPANRTSGIIPPSNLPPAAAMPEFNDSLWEHVSTPHDMLITQAINESNPSSQGFRPRNQGWYRKHFVLPSSWTSSESIIWLYFEGSFHVTTAWLNGQQLGAPHLAGYTSFAYRLDNISGLVFGGENERTGGVSGKPSENVLAVHVDATQGDGWWYEGGGLFRHYSLVRTTKAANLFADGSGVFASAFDVQPTEADGSSSATLNLTVTVANFNNDSVSTALPFAPLMRPAASASTVEAEFQLFAQDGTAFGSPFSSQALPAPAPQGVTILRLQKPLSGLQLWSVQSPALYLLQTTVLIDGTPTDMANTTIGFRNVMFTANSGLQLNGQHVKARGFCDHSNFGGVGSAVPDRVNLFRMQALRTVGFNAWRMAHNPPVPARLDFADALGVLIMDENRNFGGADQQGGTSIQTIAEQLDDMADLVVRDRNHPAVVLWSFCNEVGCNNESSAKPWRARTYEVDGTRPVTQNAIRTNLSTAFLDVQGFSHKSGSVFDTFHQTFPEKPTLATECCSCLSQRGEDEDACPNPRPGGCTEGCHIDCKGNYVGNETSGQFYNNEISQCTATQVIESDNRTFMSGTFVWSGFDYYGESRGFPQTTKCRGAVGDVAGFFKESSGWLRAWWLANIPPTDAGRPPVSTRLNFSIFIPETWIPGYGAAAGSSTRTVHVYTNAPLVELLINDRSVGKQPMPYFGTATFPNITYESGNLTAVGYDAAGAVVTSTSKLTPGPPTQLRLGIDAPNPSTGTGDALVLDGLDTAMIRAEVLDASGNLAANASTNNITFRIVSGPGMIIATHNGDPSTHVDPHGDTHPGYHGLARAFVRTTVDAASRPERRAMMLEMQPDLVSGWPARVAAPGTEDVEGTEIVVQATSPGLQPAQVAIPVTTDASKLPRAVAANSVRF